jgi:lysophospholipase L1-like esterase
VAIGDSSTEGLDDPGPDGQYHGWANRLAERVARARGPGAPPLLYANLALRGLTTHQVRVRQLELAVAMRPDLSTVFAGTNDVIARHFDADAFARDLHAMQSALRDVGATVLSFTLPDLTPIMPLARLLVSRVEALNDAFRRVSADTGAVLVDLARHPVASDPRLWSDDRLHANSEGHARIAWALAAALDLPGTADGWNEPLPERPPRSLARKVGDELDWAGRFLVPWIWRHLRGRSSGDGLQPKRPVLTPVTLGSGS